MAAGERGELKTAGGAYVLILTLLRCGGMEEGFRYRGRVIAAAEVEFIRRSIAQHPRTNRRQLSLRLCEAWGWKQANGALRDMVCRGLLLELERAGCLELTMNKSRTITVSIAWLALSFFAMPIVRAQDMVKVAPKNCKVLLDNDRVRVIRVVSKPGEKMEMHSHPAHIVYP